MRNRVRRDYDGQIRYVTVPGWVNRILDSASYLGLGLLILMLLLAGCSKTNISEYVKALAADKATVCIAGTLSTPWGTEDIKGSRTNIQNGNVQCTKDGLTVTSTPPAQPVGVQLVPVPPR